MTEGYSCLEWQEKRRYDRIATKLDTRVRNRTLAYANRDRAAAHGVPSCVTDLSFVGSKVSGEHLLGLPGHCLELTFVVPDGESFALLGQVVRYTQIQPKGFDVGLRFFRVSVQDQIRLTRILHALDRTMRLRSRPLSPFSTRRKRSLDQNFSGGSPVFPTRPKL